MLEWWGRQSIWLKLPILWLIGMAVLILWTKYDDPRGDKYRDLPTFDREECLRRVSGGDWDRTEDEQSTIAGICAREESDARYGSN